MDESLIEFPCEFPVKAFGRDADGFAERVIELVRRHAPAARIDTARPSRSGRYVAVTVRVRATSREQLDAIYGDLAADECVLNAL